VHADGGRGEGVVGWEEKGAPVLTAGVGGGRGPGEDVVPFEDVRFRRVRDNVGGWVGLDGLVFSGKLTDISDGSRLGKVKKRTRLLAARVAMACEYLVVVLSRDPQDPFFAAANISVISNSHYWREDRKN